MHLLTLVRRLLEIFQGMLIKSLTMKAFFALHSRIQWPLRMLPDLRSM